MVEQPTNFMGGRSQVHPVNIANHLSDEKKRQLIAIFEGDSRPSAEMLLVLCTTRDDAWRLIINKDETIDPAILAQGKSSEAIDVIATIFGELYITKDLRDMNARDALQYAKIWKKQLTGVAYNTLSSKFRINPKGINLDDIRVFLANNIGHKEAKRFDKFLQKLQKPELV